jgi:hypothetical protein
LAMAPGLFERQTQCLNGFFPAGKQP